MSLYAEYIAELDGRGIVERPEGFATYKFVMIQDVEHCYIEDIYVQKAHRKSGVAAALADDVAAVAKAAGVNRLLGSIKPSNNGATVSLKAQLAYGFEVLSAENNAIFLVKNI